VKWKLFEPLQKLHSQFLSVVCLGSLDNEMGREIHIFLASADSCREVEGCEAIAARNQAQAGKGTSDRVCQTDRFCLQGWSARSDRKRLPMEGDSAHLKSETDSANCV
jgi:hypothetical protein